MMCSGPTVKNYLFIALAIIHVIVLGSIASVIVTAPYLFLMSGGYDALNSIVGWHQLVGWYQVVGTAAILLFALHVRAEFKRWDGQQCGYPSPWLFFAAALLPLACSLHFLFLS